MSTSDVSVAREPSDDRHRGRTVAAAILGVLAVLVLTMTVVAVWAKATVLRSESVAELVGDALEEPDVQTALAAYLTDQVAAAVDLEAVLVDQLPDSLDRFAAAVAGGAQARVERALTRVLAEPQVQEVLTTVVERAHERAMSLLRGDGLADGISVVDGAVTLNLLPLVERGLLALQSVGLLQDVDVPELSAAGDPDEQAAALSDALGRELPEDFGQLVVYRSDSIADAQASVETAQRVLAVAERAVWVLVALSVVLVAATILVAARRWRAALLLGIGTVAAMVVLRSAARRVAADAPDLVLRPGAKAALDAILDGAAETLLRVAGVVLLVGLVVVVVALFRTHWRRTDLVLVVAVAVGAAVVAIVGMSAIGLILGVLAGVAVPLLARALMPVDTVAPDDVEPTSDLAVG